MLTRIKIYTTPTCPYCKMLKKFLTKKRLSYEEMDITLDPGARRKMIEVSGQMGVPVITIGKKVIIGFDRPRLEKLLRERKDG